MPEEHHVNLKTYWPSDCENNPGPPEYERLLVIVIYID
jgi:hypothetical protein